jgi:hypothetical protein
MAAAGKALNAYDQANRTLKVLSQSEKGINALLAANGITQAATGRDLFGKQLTKEEQQNSLLQGVFMMNLFTRKLAISPAQKAIVHEQGQAFKDHVTKVVHNASEAVGANKWKPAMAGVPDDFAKAEKVEALREKNVVRSDKAGTEGNSGLSTSHKISSANKETSRAIEFNIEEIKPKLKTEPDTAFFWSGRTDGIGGADLAADIAKRKHGVTLESTIEAKK